MSKERNSAHPEKMRDKAVAGRGEQQIKEAEKTQQEKEGAHPRGLSEKKVCGPPACGVPAPSLI